MTVHTHVFTASLLGLLEKFCDHHGLRADQLSAETAAIDVLLIEIRASHQDEDFNALQQLIAKNSGATVFLFTSEFAQNLLIQAMRLGVREVLPVDSTATDLEQAWQRSLFKTNNPLAKSQQSARKKQVVSFLPCKGGSGATLLACNLAYYLAQEAKQVIAFIDLDLHTGDATFYLCNDLQKNSLADLTHQIERLDGHLFNSSLHAVLPNFQLLAAPVHAEHALTMKPDHIDKVVSLARQNFDLVLLDLNSALNAFTLKALDHSDVICIVMDFSIMHMRDAKRLLTLLLSLGYTRDKFRLIGIDHANADEIDPKKIEEGLGMPLYLMVPAANKAADDACHQGLPLSKISGGHVIMSSIQKLANLLFSIPAQKSNRWLANWF